MKRKFINKHVIMTIQQTMETKNSKKILLAYIHSPSHLARFLWIELQWSFLNCLKIKERDKL